MSPSEWPHRYVSVRRPSFGSAKRARKRASSSAASSARAPAAPRPKSRAGTGYLGGITVPQRLQVRAEALA